MSQRYTKRDYLNMINLGLKTKRRKKRKRKNNRGILVTSNKDLFNVLGNKSVPRSTKNLLIDSMNGKQMNAVRKLITKFVSSRYKVSPVDAQKIAKDREFIIKFIQRLPLKQQKNILKQKGGVLGLLPLALKLATPLLGTVLGGIIK